MNRIGPLFLLAIVAGFVSGPIEAQESGSVVAFEGVDLWDGTGSPVRRATVVVEGGRIVSIGEGDAPAGARVVAGSGFALTPGFIAPEFTGAMTGGANEQSSEITPTFESLTAVDRFDPVFERMLERGVTTVCIPPGTANVIGGFGCVVRPGESGSGFVVRRRLALEIVLGPDPSVGNGRLSGRAPNFFVRRPTTRMGVVWLLRKTFADLALLAEGRPAVEVQKEVGGPYTAEEIEVLGAAASGRLDVRVTCFPAHDIRNALRMAEGFGFADRVVLVGGSEAWKVVEELQVADRPLVFDYRHDPETLRLGDAGEIRLDAPRRLAEGGVRFCLSTLYSLEEGPDLRITAAFARRYGLEPARALSAITLEAARILGIDDETGSIEVGKRADLVLTAGDPLEPSTPIQAVFSGGVLRAGEWPGAPTEEE